MFAENSSTPPRWPLRRRRSSAGLGDVPVKAVTTFWPTTRSSGMPRSGGATGAWPTASAAISAAEASQGSNRS